MEVGVYKKSYESPSGPTNNASCLRHGFANMCFLYKEKCTLQNCMFFEISSTLMLALCFLPSAARSLKNNGPGGSKLGFG